MAFYLLAINKNEAAICITQVVAFHFLTNYLSTIQKNFLIILSVESGDFLSPDSFCLLQSDDVQRVGWNLYRSTILLCSYVVFYRIDVGRIVDGVLL